MNVTVLLWKKYGDDYEELIGVYSSENLSLEKARELEEEDPRRKNSGYWIHHRQKLDD